MEQAPYRADLAEGPDKVRSVWALAEDEARLRVVVWPADAARGTILLFPGRTEYIEKYGRVARDLTGRGYSVASLDWRGQGFSDRLAGDRLLGHVLRFSDYQADVAALVRVAGAMDLPKPWFLVAHSMGGCIGLRALIEGMPVKRAVFSAPMWGIEMRKRQRPVAAVLPGLARLTGQGERYAPGRRPVVYDPVTGFEGNPLTTDRDHFDYLSRQLAGEEQFALGGPSLHWLGEALGECRKLRGLPRPEVPVLTFLGTDERIVSKRSVVAMFGKWQGAELRLVEAARHELMMEAPEIRSNFIDSAVQFFDAEVGN